MDHRSSEILSQLKAQLDLLRLDRTSYIKAADVDRLYRQLEDAVLPLQQHTPTGDAKPVNDVDAVLDQTLVLMALFFLTIGRNKEAPSSYAYTTVVRILSYHLMEHGVYSRRDLRPIETRLAELQDNVERSKDKYAEHMLYIYSSQIKQCQSHVAELLDSLNDFTPDLEPYYEQLVSIRRQLVAAAIRSKYVPSETAELQEKLNDIGRQLPMEITSSARDIDPKPKTAIERVRTLFSQCNIIAANVAARQFTIAPSLQSTFNTLLDTKGKLEKLSLTQAWSLRETDIFDYLQTLRGIDIQRKDGQFVDANGNAPEETQKLLLYLLRKSYAITYELLHSSEPVSEALQPIYNQLSTLRKCLVEVKRSGGISSQRELFPFSIKLASIDNLRKDGKFYIGNEIPEGQNSVNDLLAECFDICHELRNDNID